MNLPRRPLRAQPTVWVISGWLTVTITGLAIVGLAGGARSGTLGNSSHTGGTLVGLSAAYPLMGGAQVPLSSLTDLVSYSVPVPSTSIANQNNLTGVWAVASRRQAALVFDQGALTIVFKPAAYQDPTAQYQTFVSENNVESSIDQVNGLPALVISPDTDCAKSNPAWVEFDMSGTDVSIFSSTYSADLLLDVADSMAQPASSASPSPSTGSSTAPTYASPSDTSLPAPCTSSSSG